MNVLCIFSKDKNLSCWFCLCPTFHPLYGYPEIFNRHFQIHFELRFEIFTNQSLKFQLKSLLSIANPYANASVIDTITPNPGMAATNTKTFCFKFLDWFLFLKILMVPFMRLNAYVTVYGRPRILKGSQKRGCSNHTTVHIQIRFQTLLDNRMEPLTNNFPLCFLWH